MSSAAASSTQGYNIVRSQQDSSSQDASRHGYWESYAHDFYEDEVDENEGYDGEADDDLADLVETSDYEDSQDQIDPVLGIEQRVALAMRGPLEKLDPDGTETEGEIWAYWEVPETLQRIYTPTTEIRSIFTFTQTDQRYEGLDCGSYMTRR
ncbi:hypothetical protein PVAG01_08761 [Phlyctema vagabunda]|uniref:Uncharacterized protein n=1 Tax=Phlyctema vagabunda TaxID=108571 RepID=A0ABR4PAT1_9HELO